MSADADQRKSLPEGLIIPALTRGEGESMDIIDAYLEHLVRRGRTEATLDDRRKLLLRLDRELPFGVAEVATEDLRVWLHKDGRAQNSKATYLTALRSFYRWASDPLDPWLDINPVIGMEGVAGIQGVPRPATDEQLHTILTQAAEPYRTWAKIAAYNGLRCIEISRLDREHITEERLFVVRGKGNKPRVHDTDAYVWDAVKGLPPGPIALRSDGSGRQDRHGVGERAKRHFRSRLHVDVTMHQLRHWLGVNAQKRYRDIRVTQVMLGHTRLSSTQIYTMGDDAQQREARATLPRLAG